MPRLEEFTRRLWLGDRQCEGHHLYDGKVPVVVGLRNLREHGPTSPVFYRFGRDRPQPLMEAIGNPRRDAADARDAEEGRVRREEYRVQVRKAAQEQAAKKAVPPAPAAGRGSPTNGGKPPRRPTGAAPSTPTPPCATPASTWPSQPPPTSRSKRSRFPTGQTAAPMAP